MDHLVSLDLTPQGVLITHAHADHIGAAVELTTRTKAAIHMHSGDATLLRRANLLRVLGRGEAPIQIPSVDVDLAGMESLCFGGLEVELVHTPGHTPGSVCFAIGGELFTGDTLFAGKAGRTDLPEGDQEALARSIELIANRYSASTTIRPGHGELASLGDVLPQLQPFGSK